MDGSSGVDPFTEKICHLWCITVFSQLLKPTRASLQLCSPYLFRIVPFPLEYLLTWPSTSGGTKGIGRAITLDLATRGSAILATYSSQASANSFEELKEKIESVYRAANVDAPKLVGVNADITDPSAPNVIITSLISHFEGKLDILVFNAAVMSLARMGDGAMDDAFLDRFMVGNLKFPIMLMDRLVAQERVRPGSRVIAISSEAVRAKRPAGG